MRTHVSSPPLPSAPLDRYRRLFSLEIRHEFYGDSESADGPCAGLELAPSPATSQGLASLGLVFRASPSRCDVFVGDRDAAALPARIAALRARAAESAPIGRKARRAAAPWLTFLLIPSRSDFVSITNLPLGFKPTEQNVYLCNLDALGEPGAAALPAASAVDPKNLLASSGQRTPWPRADGGGDANAVVSDISGAIVLSKPEAAGSPPLSVDLGSQPPGLYTITVDGRLGKRLIHAPGSPIALGLVDIALAPASPGAAGIYPVPALDAGAGRIGEVRYVASFKARRTYWDYYVAPLGGNDKLVDIEINGRQAAFKAKADGRLPNGQPAAALRSTQPLLLRKRSPYSFRLTGSRIRSDGSRGEIQIGRLPAAPAAPVWPVDSEAAAAASSQTGCSEIFVYV